ncbi:MAG: hypothetical protein CEN89_48 [Candidatus Berkelbacteria bacterium Licking1014_7]|uniref:Uncharacterized protein n=1 Tax=Candidatus Berkelbacteria bacterium Licking1014_7 TaxID=2017147 RepID=A0A554LKW5_9BACT|nr:MAG: hypothetical protein CEN89_48 [Candidatus Berkelbacteria bacterium Licking1014_7]
MCKTLAGIFLVIINQLGATAVFSNDIKPVFFRGNLRDARFDVDRGLMLFVDRNNTDVIQSYDLRSGKIEVVARFEDFHYITFSALYKSGLIFSANDNNDYEEIGGTRIYQSRIGYLNLDTQEYKVLNKWWQDVNWVGLGVLMGYYYDENIQTGFLGTIDLRHNNKVRKLEKDFSAVCITCFLAGNRCFYYHGTSETGETTNLVEIDLQSGKSKRYDQIGGFSEARPISKNNHILLVTSEKHPDFLYNINTNKRVPLSFSSAGNVFQVAIKGDCLFAAVPGDHNDTVLYRVDIQTGKTLKKTTFSGYVCSMEWFDNKLYLVMMFGGEHLGLYVLQ